ncbi:MAG: hypothetical protein IPO94_02705 [Saprospiraceae bacterium]|nr:hypothetical protein [Saprospiraceae bacterium]
MATQGKVKELTGELMMKNLHIKTKDRSYRIIYSCHCTSYSGKPRQDSLGDGYEK